MDVGLILVATTRTGDLAALARRTETIGFDSLWIPEHIVLPNGSLSPFPFAPSWPEHYGRWVDPFVALTVAATATTRLKLATGVCLLPERDPLVTAKVVASLDYYSGGRVILGVGAGGLKEELEVMGRHSDCAGSGCERRLRRCAFSGCRRRRVIVANWCSFRQFGASPNQSSRAVPRSC